MQTIFCSIEDSDATELLTKRDLQGWSQWLKEQIAAELLQIREKYAYAHQPAIVAPDTSTWVATIAEIPPDALPPEPTPEVPPTEPPVEPPVEPPTA